MNVFVQFVSVAGAALILGAFFALQRGWWTRHQTTYLWCNLVGAALLTAVAVWDRRIGFILLEAAWGAVALVSLTQRTRAQSPGP